MSHRVVSWLAVASVAFLASCRSPQGPRPAPEPVPDPMLAVNTLRDAPPDFAARRIESGDYPIPPWAKFLKGVRICLDPGHGGDAHRRAFKRGPTGVREAEVNLRVAQYLRELLTRAGAEVRLTRVGDVDLSLAERAGVANDWPADLFISLHHNAVDRPTANHTTVWYHGGVDDRPSNLDLARYLCGGLYDMLRLPEIADVPLKSDQLMYPEGFGVLRHARVTSALSESSFHSNPEEEQRLRDPEYNLREAYGLFLGLARYAAGGLPSAWLIEPADGVIGSTSDGELLFELDDGLRGRRSWGWQRSMILADTIAVRLDGEKLAHAFDPETYRLTVELPDEPARGEHVVEVQFQNMNKNSVLEPRFEIVVAQDDRRPGS